MAEPLLFAGGAWVLGMVEGGSVFMHYSSSISSSSSSSGETSSPGSLLLPSFLYGTLALPMSLIGESPGPALLQMLPLAPAAVQTGATTTTSATTTAIDKSLESSGSPTQQMLDNSKQGQSVKVIKEQVPGDVLIDEEAAASSKNNRDNQFSTKIHKLRQENRKALEEARIQKSALSANNNVVSKYNKTITSSQYFATLHGGSLPTASSEALRRLRLLLVGAGLVSLYMSSEKKRSTSNDSTTVDTRSLSSKDYHALRDKAINSSGHVILRFVTPDSQVKMNSIPGRVPIVCQQSSIESLPLSKEWMLDVNGTNHLVIEADLSPPLREWFQKSSYSVEWLDKIAFATAQIQSLARRKKLMRDTESAVTLVVVGNVPTPSSMFQKDKTVFVDAKAALLQQISSKLLSAQNSMIQSLGTLAVSDKSAISTNNVKSEEDATASDNVNVVDTVDVFESLGMAIRQSLGQLSSTIATSWKTQPKVLQVVADNPNIVNWIRQNGSSQWNKVEWIDTSNENQMNKLLFQPDKPSVILVCCDSDERTGFFVDKIAKSKSKNASIEINTTPTLVALFEQQSMQDRTQQMLTDVTTTMPIDLFNIESHRRELFDQVQDLIKQGKSPLEAQECFTNAQ